MVPDEIFVDSFRSGHFLDSFRVELADAFNPNWMSLFVNAMVTVGVTLKYIFLLFKVKIMNFVDLVVFAPFYMVCHHCLDFWNFKFSSSAKP